MRPKTEETMRRSSTSSSPGRDRSPNYQLRATSLLDRDLITTPDEFQISPDYNNTSSNPRSFPDSVKLQCWEKAEKVKGRDPERWRRDYLGNIVFRKFVGCADCACYDYDHKVPGGESTLENCQVVQATVLRLKGNQEISKDDLTQKSSYCRVSGPDMDNWEFRDYGDVRSDSGGCSIL